MDIPELSTAGKRRPLDPFRRAVIRGLGVLLPPLLTIVIFVWIGNTVANYLLGPMESGARRVLVNHYQKRILPSDSIPEEQLTDGKAPLGDVLYQQTTDGRFVPAEDYEYVKQALEPLPVPDNANKVYRDFVDRKFLQPHVVIPLFLCVFLLVLYLLGRFLAAGVGRFFLMQIERIINRLPVIRNVYSSVKQVTDFLFSEREIEYTRVVAIEYPRKGIWTIAMVTGESLLDIRCAANEPVLSVLVPTSPMPFTGFTVTVKKSETIDLKHHDRTGVPVHRQLRRGRAVSADFPGAGGARSVADDGFLATCAGQRVAIAGKRLTVYDDASPLFPLAPFQRSLSRDCSPLCASALAQASWPNGRPTGWPSELRNRAPRSNWWRSPRAATLQQVGPIAGIGLQGVFTKEIQIGRPRAAGGRRGTQP